jgi:iron-sulfur cluster insertion protein
MFEVTEKAKKKLLELQAPKEPLPFGIRIQVLGAGCAGFQYQIRFEAGSGREDRLIEQDGLRLVIDSSSWVLLQETTLDYLETPSGSGFQFSNSPAGRCTGCGGACK